MASDDSDLKAEHSEWKKKTPFSYDFLISHSLPFQSLTVDWSSPLAHFNLNPKPSLALHTLLFATYYRETKSSFLTIADVPLPTNDDPLADIPKVEVTRDIILDDIAYAARFMPQKPNIVCAKMSSPGISVFDCTKPQEANHYDPDLILTDGQNLLGHGEFCGLAWHPNKEGYILSSDCSTICVWNVPALDRVNIKELHPLHVYNREGYNSVVQDVQWHLKNENLFGSVGQEGELIIWDLRTNRVEQSIITESEMNSLSFHPVDEWILATASDTTVGVFDMRKLKKKVHTLNGHTKEVEKVEWDPNHVSVLASSGGNDRKVIIWDINRIGDERSKGDSKDKIPELLFSHEGHIDTVVDFSWNKHEPWVISSVSQDETLHVWKLAQYIRQ